MDKTIVGGNTKGTTYKKTLSGSVGAGMGAVFNPGGRKYYILEHKVSSHYHKAGETQEIIVDQIELGRDPSCQVRFDEQFETVSRRHAAIVRDGDNWKLVQLSKTNTTFLNGHPVKDEWYLQNGDEIQLSVNGPKLGFIVPVGNRSTVGSIGLSRRLSLFRQQALRPYRITLIIVASLLLLALLVGGYFIYRGHKSNESLQQQLKHTEQQLQDIQVKHKKEMDSMMVKFETIKSDLGEARKVSSAPVEKTHVRQQVNKSEDLTAEEELVMSFIKNTYYVTALSYTIVSKDGTETVLSAGESYEIGDNNVTVPTVTGAGFLLNNGVFVTTRDVVEPWLFSGNEIFVLMNLMYTQGAKIVADLYFTSRAGDEFQLKSDYFTCNRSTDVVNTTDNGIDYTNTAIDSVCYAYARIDMQGGVPFNRTHQVKSGQPLMLMGYPQGYAADVTPAIGCTESAFDGLRKGFIVMQNVDVDNLAAGSMVVASNGNDIYAIGVLLGFDSKSQKGIAIPLSAIHF